MQTVFLCGARDYHAIDWYKSSRMANIKPCPIILTDLIVSEGFKCLVCDDDNVYRLLIIDRILFSKQSYLGDIWRNLIKLLVFPIQVVLIRIFALRNPHSLYYAHSMYYIWLAWAAGLKFVGTPQGSDILIKPFKSKIYRLLSRISMRSALLVTVDSTRMANAVNLISNRYPLIIQNGIDLPSIRRILGDDQSVDTQLRTRVVSFRGFTSLYCIHEILKARNCSVSNLGCDLDFIYPFYDQHYLDKAQSLVSESDRFLGRILRERMYHLFAHSLLCISIPSSDSSPRSVYEAIFCGAPVAVTDNNYIYDLPSSMRSRIIVVDLEDPNWFDYAVTHAHLILKQKFTPCLDALSNFDQLSSFKRLHHLSMNIASS